MNFDLDTWLAFDSDPKETAVLDGNDADMLSNHTLMHINDKAMQRQLQKSEKDTQCELGKKTEVTFYCVGFFFFLS